MKTENRTSLGKTSVKFIDAPQDSVQRILVLFLQAVGWRLKFFFSNFKNLLLRNFTWLGFVWVMLSPGDYQEMAVQLSALVSFRELAPVNMRNFFLFGALAAASGVLMCEAVSGGPLRNMLESMPTRRTAMATADILLALLFCAILFVHPVSSISVYSHLFEFSTPRGTFFFAATLSLFLLLTGMSFLSAVKRSISSGSLTIAWAVLVIGTHHSIFMRVGTLVGAFAFIWWIASSRYLEKIDAVLSLRFSRIKFRMAGRIEGYGAIKSVFLAFLFREARVSFTLRTLGCAFFSWVTWMSALHSKSHEQFLMCFSFTSCWTGYLWSRFFEALKVQHQKARYFMNALPVNARILRVREWMSILAVCYLAILPSVGAAFSLPNISGFEIGSVLGAQVVLLLLLSKVTEIGGGLVVLTSFILTNLFALGLYNLITA